MAETAAVSVPPDLLELVEHLFERVEARTGWNLTGPRQVSLEIVRDGQGYRLFCKGQYALRDLDEPQSG